MRLSISGSLIICLVLHLLLLSTCSQPDSESGTTNLPPDTTNFSFEIVESLPHDPEAFTQGLVFHRGYFYEGTGLYGRSSLRKVVPQTGEVARIHLMDESLFGEGIALLDDRIIQLTWRSNTGFVYDRDNFETIGTFSYTTEGWGLTFDGECLIMSDGSATLYFLDPKDFTEIKQVTVHDANGPVCNLNELEYIYGEIFANIWKTDVIARIDPETGWVRGRIDLKGILNLEGIYGRVDVLNGIAYDSQKDRIFVTGKLWPKLFHIELLTVD